MELLQQIRVIDPSQNIDRPHDVLIIDSRVKEIGERITEYPAQTELIPGKDLVLGTGLVDLYSHSQEPGNETRENFADLMNAAAAGGFTQVGILPDTSPSISSKEVLGALKSRNESELQLQPFLPQLHFWGAASVPGNIQQMNQLGELKAEVIGFCDRYNLGNLNLFKQLLEYVQPWQKTIAVALDRNELTENGVIREGAASVRYGISGNPSFSESAAIAAVLEIVAQIPAPVHIMRVSTARGVELITDAKRRNIPVTASTTWMHLLWDTEAVGSYDPNLRLEPPLGNKADREALIAGIENETIDAIAIDHQAFTYEEKTVPFGLAPSGVIGLEIALPLLWQKLVLTQKLTALELWRALSSNPYRCWQQPIGISRPKNNRLVLFDPQKTWIADRNNLKSPAANTPYYNQKITGKVIKSITQKL